MAGGGEAHARGGRRFQPAGSRCAITPSAGGMVAMRILVAGDPASIHTARFVELLVELGHEVHLVSVEWHYGQEEHLRSVTLHVALAYLPPANGIQVDG